VFDILALCLLAISPQMAPDEAARPLAATPACSPDAPSATLNYSVSGVKQSVTVCGEPIKIDRASSPSKPSKPIKPQKARR